MDPFSNVTKIPKQKLDIIRKLAEEIKDLPIELAIPYIAKTNSELAAKNMSFSQDELNYLLDQITENLPPTAKARIQILRGMLNQNK